MKTLLRFLALASIALGTTPKLGLAQDSVIRIDGSSTVYPITKLAAEAYERKNHNKVKVDVEFSGSSAGFRAFVEGKIDIADASRPILQDEIDKAKSNGIRYVELIIGYDALTVAVNPKNTWARDIKTSELKKLWEQNAEGKITRWSQIREGWPDEEIVLFGAGGDSGTYDYFCEVIVGKPRALRTDYTGSENDDVIVDQIAANPQALGFLPMAYAEHSKDRIRALGIEPDYNALTGTTTQARPVQPSVRAVHQGYYVPLGRPLFLYVNVNSLESKPNVEDFLAFFLGNAAHYVNKAGYMALSDIAYQRGIGDTQSRRHGTRFGGKIVTSVPHSDIYTLEQK